MTYKCSRTYNGQDPSVPTPCLTMQMFDSERHYSTIDDLGSTDPKHSLKTCFPGKETIYKVSLRLVNINYRTDLVTRRGDTTCMNPI